MRNEVTQAANTHFEEHLQHLEQQRLGPMVDAALQQQIQQVRGVIGGGVSEWEEGRGQQVRIEFLKRDYMSGQQGRYNEYRGEILSKGGADRGRATGRGGGTVLWFIAQGKEERGTAPPCKHACAHGCACSSTLSLNKRSSIYVYFALQQFTPAVQVSWQPPEKQVMACPNLSTKHDCLLVGLSVASCSSVLVPVCSGWLLSLQTS